MTTTLKAATFRDSQRSFLEALDAQGIEYNRRIQLCEAPMAAGITIEIIISAGWGVLAVACLAWAHVSKGRQIIVTTKDELVIGLKGYSADDAAKILASTKQIVVIDTKAEKDETSKNTKARE